MACLAYKPTKVKYKNESFERIELHNMKIHMVENLQAAVNELYPWVDLKPEINKHIDINLIQNERKLQSMNSGSEQYDTTTDFQNMSSFMNDVVRSSSRIINEQNLFKYVQKSSKRPKTNSMNSRFESKSDNLSKF